MEALEMVVQEVETTNPLEETTSFEEDMFNKAIDELSGMEAEDMAKYFEDLGIKAVISNSESCAIAEYVKMNVG